MTARFFLGAMAVVAGLVAAACGTAGSAGGGGAGERTLTDAELDSVCWEAATRANCAITTSAEGDHTKSCECAGVARGDNALMTLSGTSAVGQPIEEPFDLRWDGTAWQLVEPQE
ncbi:MAG: hypothetical protein H6745_30080 [Deltaproteobacteria bacterium]|nr:hypothetical protein [Deltaproteobacteria bacterium]